MCYYDQTLWSCGYWRWGGFRQQCTKEYRTGETCGLKLVYTTEYRNEPCKLCEQMLKKQRSLDKLYDNIQRWHREGNRKASIEKAENQIIELSERIRQISAEHQIRKESVT